MEFQARNDRYDQMQYRRCGRSGLMLPLLSLGLWHNFGSLQAMPPRFKQTSCLTT